MELFLKRSKGSITVLVTLILVPTIFYRFSYGSIEIKTLRQSGSHGCG